MGTMEGLLQWVEQDHHVDPTNRELVLTLAANVLTNGTWRNNSRSRNPRRHPVVVWPSPRPGSPRLDGQASVDRHDLTGHVGGSG